MNTDSLKNDSKLEYLNSFAAVFEDAILAHKYNLHTPIQIEYIKKIMLSKKRVLTLNWISFILGFSLLITWFLAKPFSQMVTFLLLNFSLTLITISFIIKKYKYKFIILKINNELISIRLEKNEINDAKAIVKLMTKKLKKKNSF